MRKGRPIGKVTAIVNRFATGSCGFICTLPRPAVWSADLHLGKLETRSGHMSRVTDFGTAGGELFATKQKSAGAL
jgi:hypothetical protein